MEIGVKHAPRVGAGGKPIPGEFGQRRDLHRRAYAAAAGDPGAQDVAGAGLHPVGPRVVLARQALGPDQRDAQLLRQPVFIVAAAAAALSYGVMNLLMAATPLAMQVCGFSFDDAALVLEWHVIGMFAPGFFTGHLIKKFGTLPIMGVGVLLNAVCIAIALSGVDLMQFLVVRRAQGILHDQAERIEAARSTLEIQVDARTEELRRSNRQLEGEVAERRQAESKLNYLAYHDPLTGLANRRYFLERLEASLADAAAKNSRVAVLFIDLDHMIIPDVFTVGGAAVGLMLSLLLPSLHGQSHEFFAIAS